MIKSPGSAGQAGAGHGGNAGGHTPSHGKKAFGKFANTQTKAVAGPKAPKPMDMKEPGIKC